MDISKFTSNEKIRGKERELEKLANSSDGERIKGMVDGKKLQKALDERVAETFPVTCQLGHSFSKNDIIESGFMI